MSSDARYQSTPSPEQPRHGEDSIGDMHDFKRRGGGIWWTRGQMLLIGILPVSLGLTFIFMWIANREYIHLLWMHPMGIKMCIGASTLILLGLALYLSLSLGINWLFPVHNPDRRTGRILVSLLVNVILLVLFFGPALFTLLVGPAAIQIQENLTAP